MKNDYKGGESFVELGDTVRVGMNYLTNCKEYKRASN